MSRVGVGIDFGTSNSVAAVYDGENLSLIRLEKGQDIMPSATYLDSSKVAITGEVAVSTYIRDNTGRTVELVPEVIGVRSEFSGSEGSEEITEVETKSENVYGAAVTDSGLKGRLFRGVKRLLGDNSIKRLMVFDQPFRLVALITPLLRDIKQRIEDLTGPLATAHLGHPVRFEGKDLHASELAKARLSEAFKYAGITDQKFCPEPIAAAISYLHTRPRDEVQRVLTLDFGGGTLDFCILDRGNSGFKVLSTHGIGLGGDHIDQLLYRHLLFPHLGKGKIWRRKGFDREIETPFPFEDYEDLLLNWAVTYTLNQNRFTAPVMECIESAGEDAKCFVRLRDIIKHNLSYVLFTKIRDLKAELSISESAALDLEEIDLRVELTRAEFESVIRKPLDQMTMAVDETLRKSQIDPSSIDVVLRTGGSSLIPAVKQILDQKFPGKVVEHDPFTSVAGGLAIASYEGLSF
tara:strand:+ start:193 stop:1584 length:1392 start_codon:yes stop_codon:yes gene_type:complete